MLGHSTGSFVLQMMGLAEGVEYFRQGFGFSSNPDDVFLSLALSSIVVLYYMAVG